MWAPVLLLFLGGFLWMRWPAFLRWGCFLLVLPALVCFGAALVLAVVARMTG